MSPKNNERKRPGVKIEHLLSLIGICQYRNKAVQSKS